MTQPRKILTVFGTRPEDIKLFPLIHALEADPRFVSRVCVSAQHRDMLDQVLEIAGIVPHHDLDLMTPGQTLDALTARALTGIGEVLDREQPDWVVVQGDTTTVMAGALAAYYRQIPVCHVEAGLRSGDIHHPWPEEVNRRVVGSFAALHCAPTETAAAALGTTETLRDLIARERSDLALPGLCEGTPDVSIAYCPERVLPGRILEELTHNDRSIGGITPRCARKALAFYKRFVKGECVTTDVRSAEMTKLVENAFRDVNIAFANELSMIGDRQGLDVWEVIRLANRHPRVNILTPGPGVGGHCIAVDPWFIVHGAPEDANLIRQARQTNDAKMAHVLARAKALIAANPAQRVACLGLAFKANIDDFRESPARFVAAGLAREFGERVHVVEPYAGDLPPEFAGTGALLVDLDTALEDCGIIVVLVDHDIFKVVPPEERRGALVYDTRGIWPDAS